MQIKCKVCEKDRPKRKVITRMPLVEIELPEEYREYREFVCMNAIKERRKDKKWYDNVCENHILVLKKK